MKLWVLALAVFVATPAFAQVAEGTWSGAIDNHLLTLVRIENGKGGKLSGTITSHEKPLENADPNALTNAALDNVEMSGGSLRFTVPALGGGIFDGKWDATRRKWSGTFQWGAGGYKSSLTLGQTAALTLADMLKPRVYTRPGEEAGEMMPLIDDYVEQGRFMGSILVGRGKQTFIDKGYGFAELSAHVPNAPDTRYHIASVTKSLTATAVLMLQDEGRLDIDDPVSRYIANAPVAWEGVTIRQLLAHRSGIGDYIQPLQSRHGDAFTPAQLIDAIRLLPLEFKPGEQSRYSNSGYILLGAVIEKASGMSYRSFLKQKIFTPLRMTSTNYDPESDRLHHPVGYTRHARGYEGGDDGPVPADYWDLSFGYSAGGIVSTTRDLRKWQQALFGGKLLSVGALAEMEEQGLGLMRITSEGQTLYNHGGHVPGYVSYVSYQPDSGLSVIVLGNLDNSSPVWIAEALTKIAHGFDADVVPMPKAIEVAPAILEQYVGTYALSPEFSLVITLENGSLVVRPTGQTKVRIFPETPTIFFAKSTEIKIEFVAGSDGRFDCILHQLGQKVRGVRKPES